jgi:hypothetical protein
MYPTITRAQFREAIEDGIARAETLPEGATSRLRKVGDTAKWIGVGTYGEHGCSCPLTRAKLTNTRGELTPLAERLGVVDGDDVEFASGFDLAVNIMIDRDLLDRLRVVD